MKPDGNDALTGTSIAQAWRSIARINSQEFTPGDSILLEAGSIFEGSIQLAESDAGSESNPLVISTYGGQQRAIIQSLSAAAINAYNLGAVEVHNLHLMGSGMNTNTSIGVSFYHDLAITSRLPGIRLSNLEVEGFGVGGIYVGTNNPQFGFSFIHISNCKVHDVKEAGIQVYGKFDVLKTGYASRDLRISDCEVFNVPGISNPNSHSGSGIVVADFQGGLIQYCKVYDCGSANIHCGGPVGIWAWDGDSLIIQFCEAYGIRNGTGCDGGGFDLDGGMTNSIMQYNYSHDNDGAGFLIAQFGGARPMKNNTIRFNISENDGRENQYGGVVLWVSNTNANGGNQDCYIYNNTLVADLNLVPGGGGMRVWESPHVNVHFRNNLILSLQGTTLNTVQFSSNDVKFENNLYFSNLDQYRWSYGAANYTSLSAFRSSGQEMLAGNNLGIVADPQFSNPATAGTWGNTRTLNTLFRNYLPNPASPANNAGISIPSAWGALPTHDFLGQPLNGQYPMGAIKSDQVLSVQDFQPVISNDASGITISLTNPLQKGEKVILDWLDETIPMVCYNALGVAVWEGTCSPRQNSFTLHTLTSGCYRLCFLYKQNWYSEWIMVNE
ncbi:MAG: right-handed parallel beta-helix repeat-containing protein [Cytophagaceae bacterium]|nr:right-handed parallel beta-helix repeat-containing protein [Cytophagaceae bacterium]